MPPRKRNAPTAAQDDAERAASPPASDASAQDDDFGPDGQPRGSMPFFNVTYTTHRASPLHIGSEPLSPARLQALSRRLRDTLVGDVVRGVQVGLVGGGDDGSLGRTGVLESVEWRWVRYNDLLGIADDEDGDGIHSREGSLDLGTADHDSNSKKRSSKDRRALCLELKYENAYFTASMLPSLDAGEPSGALPWSTASTAAMVGATTPSAAFVYLPLLLLRMPAPLRAVVCDFLASNFDCRIGPLHLGTRSLVNMWESWLMSNRTGKGGGKVNKDVVLTLGFHLDHLDNPPAPPQHPPKDDDAMDIDDPKDPSLAAAPIQHGLKSIDIIIPAPHVARFVRAGRKIEASSTDAQHTTSTTGKRKRGAKPAPSVFSPTPLDSGRHPERLDSLARLRRRLAGNKTEEGWNWRSAQHSHATGAGADSDDANGASTPRPRPQQPFTEAVAAYLSSHLALDMFHPAVRISKVACGGFVAAESGRLKIFAPINTASSLSSRAARRLVAELVSKASSGGVLTMATDSGNQKGGERGVGGQTVVGPGAGPWSEAARRIAELAATAAY
ncbi:Kinetochore complex Sim4 subunit Fta1 [Microdochium nivale]|nr:Kinetochore complex Sim4 subunit Fta1 [Microdochium nivale]